MDEGLDEGLDSLSMILDGGRCTKHYKQAIQLYQVQDSSGSGFPNFKRNMRVGQALMR